jgi:hypothetical protein
VSYVHAQKIHAHERCGTLKKTSISTRGYTEIYNQKKCTENSCIENPNCRHMLQCLFYTLNILILRNTKISIFGGISKFLKLIVFG